jgi:TRAP-type C4-dicarboxylate transport system permease small subunit
MYLPPIVDKLEHWIKKALEIVVFLLFALMTVLTFAQVFTRFVLNFSLSWSDELARFTLVWLIFTASILTYGEKIHIGVDVLTSKLTGRINTAVQLVNRVCILLFCVIVILGAVEFLPVTHLQKSPACGILMSYIYVAIPISMAFMGIITVREIFTLLRGMGSGKENPS